MCGDKTRISQLVDRQIIGNHIAAIHALNTQPAPKSTNDSTTKPPVLTDPKR